MGVSLNSSPSIIRSEDAQFKPKLSGAGPPASHGSIVIDYNCEMAVASLLGNRSDPSFFPGQQCFFTPALYDRLCKERPDPPDRGKVLAIAETKDFGLLYLPAGEHIHYGHDAKGKEKVGGIGFRHIYLKRFQKLLNENDQTLLDGNKTHGPIAYDPATFLEFSVAALRGEVIDRAQERSDVDKVLTRFEYKNILRSAVWFLDTRTGLVRTVADQGRKEGLKAWKQVE